VPCSSPRGICLRCTRACRNLSTRTQTRSSLKAVFFSFFFRALWLSLAPPSGGLDEHAAARSLRRLINLIFACWVTHVLIRQGLPHSTSERPAHPKSGSRVGRGFPLTVQMPQPVRPTSRVHARAKTLKITTLTNDPLLPHRHLPRGSRPNEADNLPRHRPLSLPPENHAVTVMNSRLPSCRAGAEPVS
jgi:hypothetical protein